MIMVLTIVPVFEKTRSGNDFDIGSGAVSMNGDASVFNEESECPSCKTKLIPEKTRLLACLHAICSECVEKTRNYEIDNDHSTLSNGNQQEKGNIKCRICEHMSEEQHILVHPFIEQSNDTSCSTDKHSNNKQNCTSCEEQVMADWYCIECDEWLCQCCEQAHGRVKLTKNHIVKSKKDVKYCLQSRAFAVCKEHTDQSLKYYCNLCECLTCSKCKETTHRDHHYRSLLEAADHWKSRLQEMIENCKVQNEEQSKHLKELERKMALIGEKQVNVANDIRNFTSRFIEAIQRRERQLLNELKIVCNNKRSLLRNQVIGICRKCSSVKHVIDFSSYALQYPDPLRLLYIKNVVAENLQKIQLPQHTRQIDVPQIQIQFAYDQTNLEKAITMLGMFLVDGFPYGSSAECIPTTCKAEYKIKNLNIPSVIAQPQCTSRSNSIDLLATTEVFPSKSTDHNKYSSQTAMVSSRRMNGITNSINTERLQKIGRNFLPELNNDTFVRVLNNSTLVATNKEKMVEEIRNCSSKSSQRQQKSPSSKWQVNPNSQDQVKTNRRIDVHRSPKTNSESSLSLKSKYCSVCRTGTGILLICSLCLRHYHTECILLRHPTQATERFKLVCSICQLISTPFTSDAAATVTNNGKRRRLDNFLQTARCLWLEFFINLPTCAVKQMIKPAALTEGDGTTAGDEEPSYETIRLRLMDSSKNLYQSTDEFVKDMIKFLKSKVQCDYTGWFERLLQQHSVRVDASTETKTEINRSLSA